MLDFGKGFSMIDPKKQARRDKEFQEQIIAHDGTGSPPDGDPIENFRQGICPRCGGHWDALHTHVWKHHEKQMRAEGIEGLSPLMTEGNRRFYEEFKIPDDVPRVSDKARESQSQAKLKQMSGPDGQRVKDQIAETLSRPRPDLRGKTGPEPQSGKRTPAMGNWPIVRLLTSGIGQVEAAKKLGAADHSTIGKRAKSLGLAYSTAFLCDHGEPFKNGDLFDVRRASGFEAKDFDKYAGLDEGRSNVARPSDSIANPEDSQLTIVWRDGVIKALLQVAASGERALRLGTKIFRQDEVFKTFLPKLPTLNDALISTMPEIRETARRHPEWTVDELCEEICSRAQIEESSGSDRRRWRVTMGYLWQAEQWIAKNLERLRATEVQNDGPLVREMIGSRYGASQETIQNALRDRTEIIAPSDVRALIKEFAWKFAEPKPKPPGPTPKPDKDKEPFRISAKVNGLIPGLERLFVPLGILPGRKQLESAKYSNVEIHALLEPTPADNPKNAARRIVAATEELEYDAVARYHRAFPQAGLNSDGELNPPRI